MIRLRVIILSIFFILTTFNSMAGWNISIMCVKADSAMIDSVVSDIFEKTETNIWFEDAASSRMGKDLGVSYYNGWILIIDVEGRLIINDNFPKEISQKYHVKTLWISEGLIYRDYNNGILSFELKGIEEAGKYLTSKGVKPKDEWGETRIIQIFELEIMEDLNNSWVEKMYNLKFDKYEIK